MHIPDGLLSPAAAGATGLVAAAGLAWGLRKLEGGGRERTTVLMGMMAAFVFAAQMVKFPVGPGVAGHLMGGVLAAVVLGPWAGLVVMAAVLIVQCLVFQDGGLTALGANLLNMGLIGSALGWAVYAPIRRGVGGRAGVVVGAMVAAWLSVLLSAGAFAVELAASGSPRGFFRVLGWMTLVHAAIGVGEALITGLVLRTVLQIRPDLIDARGDPAADARGWGQAALAGLAMALAVAVVLGPFASESPDGLEFVGQKLGLPVEEAPAVVRAPIPDYKAPGLGPDRVRVATALAGGLGTLVVFGAAALLAWPFARAARSTARRPAEPQALPSAT